MSGRSISDIVRSITISVLGRPTQKQFESRRAAVNALLTGRGEKIIHLDQVRHYGDFIAVVGPEDAEFYAFVTNGVEDVYGQGQIALFDQDARHVQNTVRRSFLQLVQPERVYHARVSAEGKLHRRADWWTAGTIHPYLYFRLGQHNIESGLYRIDDSELQRRIRGCFADDSRYLPSEWMDTSKTIGRE